MKYFRFNVGDYYSRTSHLTLMEDLAYRRMLDLYYKTERPLPLDPRDISRKINMPRQLRSNTVVLREFFTETENGWVNNHCDKEILKYKGMSARAIEANDKRWASKKDPKSDLTSEAFQIPTNNQEPITNKNNTKNTVSKDELKKQFDIFWKKYPKGREKPKAIEMWMKKKPPINEVLAALDWQIAEWELEDMKYVPWPAKYLKNEQWTDQPTSSAVKKKHAPGASRETTEFVSAL